MSLRFSSRNEFIARETGGLIHTLTGQGEVVSVYSKATNVLHPGGLLVSLVRDHSQMTALSIRVPDFFHESVSKNVAVKSGDKAAFEAGRLAIGDFSIDLRDGEIWEGSLVPSDVKGFSPFKGSILREALVQKGKKGGLLGLIHPEDEENPFVRKATEITTRVFVDEEKNAQFIGLSQMVGLGIGFTPSGDDFISGVLLGEEIRNLTRPDRAGMSEMAEDAITRRAIDKEEIWRAKDRTNYGGKTLLWQTLRGHFPFYLIEAARGLANANDVKEMMEMLSRASSHGETSGTDALVGLLFYLDWVAINRR
ncbi:MAG: DUF2877 domain-containing protein [Proteobacteria bacterium]|nr:DUF2877 domain-containing protein [Pseudomonadota bacterium]